MLKEDEAACLPASLREQPRRHQVYRKKKPRAFSMAELQAEEEQTECIEAERLKTELSENCRARR